MARLGACAATGKGGAGLDRIGGPEDDADHADAREPGKKESIKSETTLYSYAAGMRAAAPLAFAIGALGVAFGYLSRAAGLSTLASIAMSAATFAGSPQFAS